MNPVIHLKDTKLDTTCGIGYGFVRTASQFNFSVQSCYRNSAPKSHTPKTHFSMCVWTSPLNLRFLHRLEIFSFFCFFTIFIIQNLLFSALCTLIYLFYFLWIVNTIFQVYVFLFYKYISLMIFKFKCCDSFGNYFLGH